MITTIPLLQSVRVASPCAASWDEMQAVEGDRVKFCGQCAKNVYNLSAMSQSEAECLLRTHEGRLCVRYYQRSDGTILSGDCPVGTQMVRMALIRRSAVAAGLFTLLFGATALTMVKDVASAPGEAPHPIVGKRAVSVPPQPKVTPEPPIPLMGAVAPISKPTPPPVMGRWVAGGMKVLPPVSEVKGQIARPEISEPNITILPPILPDKPRDVDSTDEAILKPRSENTADK